MPDGFGLAIPPALRPRSRFDGDGGADAGSWCGANSAILTALDSVLGRYFRVADPAGVLQLSVLRNGAGGSPDLLAEFVRAEIVLQASVLCSPQGFINHTGGNDLT